MAKTSKKDQDTPIIHHDSTMDINERPVIDHNDPEVEKLLNTASVDRATVSARWEELYRTTCDNLSKKTNLEIDEDGYIKTLGGRMKRCKFTNDIELEVIRCLDFRVVNIGQGDDLRSPYKTGDIRLEFEEIFGGAASLAQGAEHYKANIDRFVENNFWKETGWKTNEQNLIEYWTHDVKADTDLHPIDFLMEFPAIKKAKVKRDEIITVLKDMKLAIRDFEAGILQRVENLKSRGVDVDIPEAEYDMFIQNHDESFILGAANDTVGEDDPLRITKIKKIKKHFTYDVGVASLSVIAKEVDGYHKPTFNKSKNLKITKAMVSAVIENFLTRNNFRK